MYRINYKLNKDGTVKQWREEPFNENEPFITLSFKPGNESIYCGVDKITDGVFVEGDRARMLLNREEEKKLLQRETAIKEWFVWYDRQVLQAGRAERTQTEWSATDGEREYTTLAELDAEANKRQLEMRELKRQLEEAL